VARLPRQPGQKEQRYYHLFSGAAAPVTASAEPVSAMPVPGDRLHELERRVETLEVLVKALTERLPKPEQPA
jgi:uncharacterized protein YceH (UPF0502 family)